MNGIQLTQVSKTYSTYRHGIDRLREIVTGRTHHAEFTALQPTNLLIARGEVLGIVGMNGAGKSTLLKIIAGTMVPSSGSVQVSGVVAALLELGTGFHPEMTGRENVYLYGMVMGLSRSEIDEKYQSIVDFSGLKNFMGQTVKTYSSGMLVRLAFTVATSVNPDILIVDEALSVGDGAFSRKSFERIMAFKESGKTIVFCSHSMYQVESICSRAIWLNNGKIMRDGNPAEVTSAYGAYLESFESDAGGNTVDKLPTEVLPADGRIISVQTSCGDQYGPELQLISCKDELLISIFYWVNPRLPAPTIAVVIATEDGRPLSSAISKQDGIELKRDKKGEGNISLQFPDFSLLKGRYLLQVYLACDRAIHSYDIVLEAAVINVTQSGLEQGVVHLPRNWLGSFSTALRDA